MNGNAADSWSEQVKGEATPIIRLWSPNEKGDAHAAATAKTLLAHIDAISEILKRYHFTEVDIMPALPQGDYDPHEMDYKFEIFAPLPRANGVPIKPRHVINDIVDAIGLYGSINRPFTDSWRKNAHIQDHHLSIIYETGQSEELRRE